MIESLVDPSVELIESAAPVVRKKGVAGDWLDGGCAEWGVHAVEELEEQDADAEALRRQAVRLGLRQFDDQALGAQFRQVVAQLAQTISGGGQAEGFGGALMEIARPETSATAEMRKST